MTLTTLGLTFRAQIITACPLHFASFKGLLEAVTQDLRVPWFSSPNNRNSGAPKRLRDGDHTCRAARPPFAHHPELPFSWPYCESLNVQVMETFKRVLGEEHPNTLTSMANLASTCRNQGR